MNEEKPRYGRSGLEGSTDLEQRGKERRGEGREKEGRVTRPWFADMSKRGTETEQTLLFDCSCPRDQSGVVESITFSLNR